MAGSAWPSAGLSRSAAGRPHPHAHTGDRGACARRPAGRGAGRHCGVPLRAADPRAGGTRAVSAVSGLDVARVHGAGGLQALVKGGLPIAGKRVVVAGSGPLLPAVAAYLAGKGARIRVVAEQASWPALGAFSQSLLGSAAKLRQAAALFWTLRGVPFRAGCWVTHAHGEQRLQGVTLRRGAQTWTVRCDYLACGLG